MTKNSTPAHIAVYLHTLYNGGIERVMFNLIQGFLDSGIAVDLVLDFLIYSPFEKLLPVGAHLVNLGAHNSVQRLPKLIRYLRDQRPAAMLSGTHFANELACLATWIARTNTRLVVSEHGNMSSDITVSSSNARHRLLPWTTKIIYPLADAVVAVSNGVAADVCRISGLPRNRVQTIYNPIDFKGFSEMAKQPLDNPWFATGEPPVVLGIGRLEEQKNFPSLIRAFAQVRQKRPARLLILGEGALRDQLTALVSELGLEEDISLPGFAENPANYMANSGVFVMSSLWEGMPVALIEALVLGIPVVSTDCPSGPTEILDGGKYGALVPMDDSSALADAIVKALDGGKVPADQAWLDQFDAKTVTQKYLDLLSRPLG